MLGSLSFGRCVSLWFDLFDLVRLVGLGQDQLVTMSDHDFECLG